MSGQWPYVIAAYAVAGAIILAMIAWVASDSIATSRRLSAMESQGARRRGGA